MLTAKKYDKLLKALTPCELKKDVMKEAYYKESKNNFGIHIYYANLSPMIPIAFEGIASCRKGFKSDVIDSFCVKITKISPIVREQFKMLHSNLVTQYPQYEDFLYKADSFDKNGYLVIYDKINGRFEPFKGSREIKSRLYPFKCTLSKEIKLNYKIIGKPILGEELGVMNHFEIDEDYDINGELIA